MLHLTFAVTARVPDLVCRTTRARYHASREAYIECVEARCGAAEAGTTGVWADDCPPDLKAKSQRAGTCCQMGACFGAPCGT